MLASRHGCWINMDKYFVTNWSVKVFYEDLPSHVLRIADIAVNNPEANRMSALFRLFFVLFVILFSQGTSIFGSTGVE